MARKLIENQILKNWEKIDFLKTDLTDHRLVKKKKKSRDQQLTYIPSLV